MNSEIDFNDVPPCNLHVRRVVPHSDYYTKDDVLKIVKSDMARLLAENILANEALFTYKILPSGFGIEYAIDCIVLTREELFAIRQRSFRLGMDQVCGRVHHER